MSEDWTGQLHESNAREALAILETVWPQLDVPGRTTAHIAPYPAGSSDFAGLEAEFQETQFRWDVVGILQENGVVTSARRVELAEYGGREAIEVEATRDRVVAAIGALKTRLMPARVPVAPELPSKLTLSWMWSHVPVRWWWSLALVLVSLLAAAYWAGRSRVIGRVVDVVTEPRGPHAGVEPGGTAAKGESDAK